MRQWPDRLPHQKGAALLWTVKSDPIRVTLNGSDLDEEHRCFIANTSHTPIGIVAAMGVRSLTVVAAVFAHAFKSALEFTVWTPALHT